MHTGFTFFALCLGIMAFGQGPIETDRPDQTEAAVLVPHHWFQQEFGIQYGKEQEGMKTIYHPTLLTKYGLSKIFELRLITEFGTVQTPVIIPEGNKVETGLFPIGIGTKIHFWDEKGARPLTAVIIQSGVPELSSKKFRDAYWSPEIRFTMRNTLSPNISLGYNGGMEWDGGSGKMKWLYTVSPSFALDDKCNAFIEVFGFLEKGSAPEHSLDGGLAFLLSNNSQLDFSGGVGLSARAPDFFVSMGFSYRIH